MPLPRIDRWFCRYRRTRDPRLLGDVFDRTAPELLRVARHLTRDAHRAEDLVQSTFLTAIEKADQYDAARPLLPWLLAILANHAREAHRRERRPPPQFRGEEEARDVGDHAAARELAEVCDRALDDLPEPYRHVLILHLRHGLAAHEIAHTLHRGDSTVRNQIARGLDRLRRKLPASAAPAALLLPGRGLAAVRTEVLAHASDGAAAAIAMVGIGAPLMSKKIVLPFALLIAAATWYAATSGDVTPAPAASTSPSAALSAPVPPPADQTADAMSAAVREPLHEASTRAPSPTELDGRVVQARTGIPIPGADVRLLHRDADEFWNLDIEYGEHIEELAHTTSDADGRFWFTVARGRAHRVCVRAAGFADACATSCTGGGELVVAMDLGATLEGSARDADTGKPVADVALRLVRRGDYVELAQGQSGADGSFRFDGLPACAATLRAEPLYHTTSRKEVVLEVGRPQQVVLELSTGVVLRGRVLDAVTRDPVAFAEVSDSWTFRHRTCTDGQGKFELPCTDSPFTRVYARADGYAHDSLALPRPCAGSTEILLARGGSVTGRFTGPDGEPLRVAYAAVAASPRESEVDWLRAEVGADGRFVAADMRSDLHYRLYARASGYGTLVLALPRPIAISEQLDVGTVALARAAAIEGKVVDGEGHAIGGETVRLQTPHAYANVVGIGIEGVPPPPVFQLETTELHTDAAGRFCFPDLAAGTYDVSVRLGRDNAALASVAVAEGVVREGVVLVTRAGLAIAGVIRRNDGVALGDAAGIMVRARSPRGSTMTSPAADGSFRIEGLAAGEYDLSAFGFEGWSLLPLRVAAGSTEVALILEPAATIRGRVLDAEGKPASALVSFFVPGVMESGSLYATKSDGTFELHVPPGSVGRVSASDPALSVRSAEIDGVAAGQDGLELRLRLPELLRGR